MQFPHFPDKFEFLVKSKMAALNSAIRQQRVRQLSKNKGNYEFIPNIF